MQLTHSLKGAWFQVISHQVISWFQNVPFQMQLAPLQRVHLSSADSPLRRAVTKAEKRSFYSQRGAPRSTQFINHNPRLSHSQLFVSGAEERRPDVLVVLDVVNSS
jgi:hypothetical protein